ncbi:MAG: TaqI-like C-terminal specificity domain-containing protein [Dysgonomonas mossii]|uniref:TaqI-like C-terminal specificity domain-containing protein n=1 Tax=Dysgonomonas mossii TaxID=163665 RepID=UPI0039968099
MFKLNIYKIKNSKNSIFLLYYIIILFSSVFIRQNSVNCEFGVESWVILSSLEQSIRSKIELVGTPLKDWDIDIYRGVLTGYNEAFIIDSETKEKLIKEDSKSAEIIRPILRGRDIKRYGYEFANLWLINTHNGVKEKNIKAIDVEDYPAVKKHLDKFYPELEKRQDKGYTPYNLRNCAYIEDFYKQKIIWGEISDKSKFALDNEAFFPEATSFLMVGDKLKYILAMLNSRLGEWVFNQIGTTTGVGTNRWKKYTLEKLSVKMPTELEQIHVEQMIDNIIETHSIDEIEKLDKYICQLYKLSQEEVEFIENL